ncbi:IclR family transcriptional regulator [Conservatibacter flavescens]|uniref:Transcriptional regulator n=1 Tax=Conservatibacter flavescens TaxID=28161 RepID=A0A2M8RZD2_9PAST|nr:IclR family transcriptional regulator [Conservatibacter flavescens]PJG84247.1 transcriptional regulator [Conservatibacter flavescens]
MELEVKKTTNQSLVRALSLIDILSDYPNGCLLAKLAELAELNKSTTHRMLQTLQSCGYVQQTHISGCYRLTTKCLAIGQKTLASMDILSIAIPLLNKLNQETGETVNFSMRQHDHAVMIYKLDPKTGLTRTRAYVGQHLQLYCSAMGKLFMAYDKPEYLAHYWQQDPMRIQKLTDNTIVVLDDMTQELRHIKEVGYAMDNEENEIGTTCIAYPIFNFNGDVLYALSVSLSTAKLSQWDKTALMGCIKDTAKAISYELGASAY